MPRLEISDERIKAIVLIKLRNRGCWGARYTPLDSLMHWLSKRMKRDGKRVQKALKQLFNEGYLVFHKKGAALSLNPARSKEIAEYIKRVSEI
jgi:hypothetical protein